MYMVDYSVMEFDLRALSRTAWKVAALGTELGYENKSDSEIWAEVDELVCKALLIAIRIYNKDYELADWHTPELLYKTLWDECYEYERAQTDMDDIDDETKELVDRALEESIFYLQNEYDRRSNEFDDVEIEDEEV